MSERKDTAPFLRVATVLKTKGLEGELLVQPEPGASFVFETDTAFFLAPPLLEQKTFHVREVTATPTAALLVRFAEISDRGRATEAAGRALLVEAAPFACRLPGDALSVPAADVAFPERGYEVVSDEGLALGVLTECLETGANQVWVVDREPLPELLLPVIDDLQIEIDSARRRITVHLLPGLLELNS